MAKVNRIGFEKAGSYKNIQGEVILVENIFSVDYEQLLSLGVERLVFDYDGTLSSKWNALPANAVIELLLELQKDFEITIYSNNWIFWKKRRKFFSASNITYVKTQKPFRFEDDGEMNTVIIGDKWFTDRIYAWRRHWGCVLVGKSA